MKALTISQPFASLIANGEKWVENRRWATDYRGPLAIHAGKGTQYLTREDLAHYPAGCVIAIANLCACIPLHGLRNLERKGLLNERIVDSELTAGDVLLHRYTEGPWCWVLRDVQRIPPVRIRGAQGLWDWSYASL
jgi:hypothetical protein